MRHKEVESNGSIAKYSGRVVLPFSTTSGGLGQTAHVLMNFVVDCGFPYCPEAFF